MILLINNSGWTHLGGSSSQLASLIICHHVQLGIADLFYTLSHLCDCGWDSWADTALAHILSSSSRLACNCSHDVWVGFQGSGSMQGLLQVRLWTSTVSLLWDSIGWSKSQAYSDSREGETDFTSWWEKLKSHFVQGMD